MIKDCRLFFLDLDGTTTQGNSWQRLNLAMRVTHEEDQHYYDAYHRGEITYPEWTNSLVEIYLKRAEQGIITEEQICHVLLNYSFYPGVRAAVRRLIASGLQIAVISGSMDIFVQAVAKDLRIKHVAYNSTFKFDHKEQLIGVETLGEEAKVKLDQAAAIARKLGVPLDQCVSIGDSHNDKQLFRATRGITFDRCDCLHDVCWQKVKDWHDFNMLLSSV